LARLAEILTLSPPKSILLTLRLPAVSRLQKLHNVNTVLKILRNDWKLPLSSDIAGHHIVDGHREMVLKLMWCIVTQLSLKYLIDMNRLRDEIERIESHGHRQEAFSSLTIHREKPKKGGPLSDYDEEELKQLLLRWSATVCRRFGRIIDNLSDSFADGMAICLLIHYYHPNVIRLDELTEIKMTDQVETQASLQRENERARCVLANKRMLELGGIPDIIPISDSSQPPDERCILLCLSFLCSRLLESNHELRACALIQNCYRRYTARILWKQKLHAASKIWKIWKARKGIYFKNQCIKFQWAVFMIERFVSKHQNKLKCMRVCRETSNRSAILIQVCISCVKRIGLIHDIVSHFFKLKLMAY
jgi:abnormal spindle-like microcephaly-associated protein